MFSWKTCAMVTVGTSMLAIVSLTAAQAPVEPPAGEGLDLIRRSCISCHDIYMITSKRKTPDQWAETMELMAARGAEVTPEEMQVIEEYLSQNFSKVATDSAAAHSQQTSTQ